MAIENFTSNQVNEQLDRILSAEIFQNSKTLTQFLRFVVEETLQGRARDLKEYTIAVKVLAKKSGFNPQADPVVRIHAGRLRRNLNEYYIGAGKDDEIVISIPKGTYIPEFNSRSVSGSPAISFSDNHNHVIRKKPTIAVLPFRNNSPAPANNNAVFFEDGLSDQLSTELARYSELSVVSYYSCRSIADRITDVREAGLVLDAKYILTGSVQSNAKQLRVRVQMVVSETREQLWAGSYERKSTVLDLFEIQDDIVTKVLSQVTGYYGAIFRDITKIPPNTNIEDLKIYDAIFWYYHFVNETNEDIYHKAIAAMRHAVAIGPEYALGWAVLGEIFVAGYFMGYNTAGVNDPLAESITCGRKAVKLDPLCQHGYQTLGLAYLFSQNKAETLRIVNEWTKIKPSASGIMGAMGFFLICCGEYEQGMKMMDESIQLNPYYQWWFNGGISFYYYYKEQYEEAIYWAEKINMPHIPWEWLFKTASLAELNRMDEAQRCCTQIKTHFPFLVDMMDVYVNAFMLDKVLTKKIREALRKAGI